MGLSIRNSKSSIVINGSATQPSLFRVVYTYYLLFLAILLISLCFSTMMGYKCHDGIELVVFQLLFLIPGRYAVHNDFTGYRTIFFVIQGGLILPDLFWMIMAFSKAKIVIGISLFFCALVQAILFGLAYYQPYALWPKGFNILLIHSFVKPGTPDSSSPPLDVSAERTAKWIRTEFTSTFEEGVEPCSFKVENGSGEKMKSSSDEPAFPRTVVVDAHGNRQEDTMKPALGKVSRRSKKLTPRLEGSSNTN